MGSELVSLKIQDAPLEEALRQILARHDAFFFYGVEKEGAAALRAVWVYPAQRGRGFAPLPPEAWASTKELMIDAKTSPDVSTRVRAVGTLIERKRDGAREVVMDALTDRDEQVRANALHAALGRGLQLPSESLANLALTDPSHASWPSRLSAMIGTCAQWRSKPWVTSIPMCAPRPRRSWIDWMPRPRRRRHPARSSGGNGLDSERSMPSLHVCRARPPPRRP